MGYFHWCRSKRRDGATNAIWESPGIPPCILEVGMEVLDGSFILFETHKAYFDMVLSDSTAATYRKIG